MTHFPEQFLQMMQDQLVVDFEPFLLSLQSPPSTSILLNKNKPTSSIPFPGSPLPWCEEGLLLHERPYFTHDPLLHGGAYYVMDASSMLLHQVLGQFLTNPEGKVVLDLCAAPGGKSALLSNYLGKENLLVSNETIHSRFPILQENMVKWGNPSRVLLSSDPGKLARLGPVFDLILVDAPCSGEGLFRKDPEAANLWNKELVELCSSRQKRILDNALQLLKEDGILIYSTCTYNSRENMDNVQWLGESGLESLQCNFPKQWGITEMHVDTKFGYQVYPHNTGTEGFFFSVFRNTNRTPVTGTDQAFKPIRKGKGEAKSALISPIEEPWLDGAQYHYYEYQPGEIYAFPKRFAAEVEGIRKQFPRSHAGIKVATRKGKLDIPAHDLALSQAYSGNSEMDIALSREEALAYLRRGDIQRDPDENGWYRATFDNTGLGWLKYGGQGLKNYYPMHWRVRK